MLSAMDSAVDFFKQNSKNQNTEYSTRTWVKNYKTWAKNNDKEQCLEKLDPVDLNDALEKYFSNVKKQEGGEYEPSTLVNIQAAIDRYLKECRYQCSILKAVEFKGSREVLEGRGRYLREELHMGQKPNRAQSLSLQEEEELWRSWLLGIHDPSALVNTLWFLMTLHFSLRGRQEHHKMTVEDFVQKEDDNGNIYITFSEISSKTRQAGLRKKQTYILPTTKSLLPSHTWATLLLSRAIFLRMSVC